MNRELEMKFESYAREFVERGGTFDQWMEAWAIAEKLTSRELTELFEVHKVSLEAMRNRIRPPEEDE